MSAERDFFSKGLAVGSIDIATQTVHWRFRGERYETPAEVFWQIRDSAQRCPASPVESVRSFGTRLE